MSRRSAPARLALCLAAILGASGVPAVGQSPPPKAKAKAKAAAARPAAKAAAEAPGAEVDDARAEAEERRERLAMERFLGLLEKTPRRGTALDRVYGYHVERGTLDAFIKSYEDRVAKDPKDGAGWLLLGLFEAQCGRDAAAVTALRRAEEARPDDPLPPYYLGQALVLIGQPDGAADAFERAIRRKPTRNDLLEIFQSLGRVFQRAQKTKEAAEVWSRLEALFPDDPRVQEQIAAALAEEGQPDQALPRFEALARKARDPFRQFQFALNAADLKVRMGRTDEALRDFESLLGKARPESWIYREVRRKVEEVFLRNDDQNGLAAYYGRWIAGNPEDVEALVRLGRSLAAQGKVDEARSSYEKAVKLAPSRRDLRLALIGQLVQDRKVPEAAAQYEELARAEPNNPDVLRDWGDLLLHDNSRPEAARKADAAAVWRRLLDARPKDPVTAAQVADLFRQAGIVDDALGLYRKAIDLAPHNPQYREYLGEYLHTLKRPDEARAAWGRIAEGPDRNVKNLARYSEVLAGFGYLKEAIPPLTDAVALEADDFTLRLKLADLLRKAGRPDDARAQLDAAERLASNDEERTASLEAQVRNDQDSGQVPARVDQLRKELDARADAGAPRWSRLARYLEADGKLPEAVAAAGRAIAADPRSVPAWALAARVRESAGNLADAADALRRLAEIDRRNRTEYLAGVAKLEARLGRVDQALKAGRDLIAAAPGNPESYETFAELCFQLGKVDEGLDTLRRAARVNPNETKVVLALAETLASQYRTEEAVETYWRAFDKAQDLDARVGIISRLTELYLQRNQFDRLLARLQREQNEAQGQQQRRDLGICLAQAYSASGDLGMARSELQRLLSANDRDVQLTKQLAKLSEDEGDLEDAAKYQKQLVDLAPSDEESLRLAQLYVRAGEVDSAQAIWSRMASGQGQLHRVLQAIDSLLANDKARAVLDLTEPMLRKDPNDWEALYREGVALAGLQRPDEASGRFHALLDLRVAEDEKGAIAKARTRDPRLQASGARPSQFARLKPTPLEERIGASQTIRMATHLENRLNYSVTTRAAASAWSPADFGQARMAALAWIVSLAPKQAKKLREDEVAAAFRAAGERPGGDPRPSWDWYYLSLVRNDSAQAAEAARVLSGATANDPTVLWAYLNALGTRQYGAGPRYYVAPGADNDKTPPLPPDRVDHVLACYRALRQRRPELAGGGIVLNVARELKRAGRVEDGERLYRESIEGADQIAQVAGVFGMAAERGDVDGLIRLFDKYERLQAGQAQPYYLAGSFYFQGPSPSFSQAMSVRAGAKAYDDALRLLDHYLDAARRRLERQAPGTARIRRPGASYPAGYSPSYSVWVGPTTKNVRLAFPTPNEYYDNGAIALLRTAYELYRRDDLATHFRAQVDAAGTPADALYPRLALCYLAWWDDDKDAAVAELTRAVEATPVDSNKAESDLRLILADLLEKRGDPAEALALVDTVRPLDNPTMQHREEQALRLAVLTGDLGRARQAAERLFGLRLDTDTQIRLAGQMHQLGMHEMAEAVLGRARRRAGGKATALVGLMLQYQRQDRTDTAVQVALQIIRGTAGVRNTNLNVVSVSASANDPDAARSAAIQVLARSGRLKEMIAHAEEQLQRTPGAVQLLQSLADYYRADGRRDRARATMARIAELRPDDAAMRYQVANQLVQDGQVADALGHYKAALKKEPALFGRNYNQILQAFRRANKTEELVQLVEEIDIRSVGQPYYITNLIQNLMTDDKLRDRSMALFRKAWDAFPDQRSNLISNIYRDEFWQSPEIYEYVRQVLIPDAGTAIPSNPSQQWNLFQSIISYNNDGRATTLMSRLLDLAATQNRLDELTAQVEAARARSPGWDAGEAVVALLRCRTGKFDEARAIVRKLIDRPKEDAIASDAYWVIGTELEDHAETRDLAIAAYERWMSSPSDAGNGPLVNFSFSPIKRLVHLYRRDGRDDDVRRLLLEISQPKDLDSRVSYPDSYLEQMRMQGLAAAAQQLVELGYTAEAVPLFGEAIALSDAIGSDASDYLGNRAQIIRQARDGLSLALQGLEPDQLVATIRRLLEPPPEADPKAQDKDKGPNTDASAARHGPAARDQAVDLVLLIHPREVDKAAVKSLFAEAIAAAARDPKQLASIDATIDALRDRHPDDLSVRVAASLSALAGGDAGRIEKALEDLEAFVAARPPEPLAGRARANARQRAEATRLLPLWLVARACWARESTRAAGDRLADRALEAARRQADDRWTLAMLRERGLEALDRGDRAGAEAAWGLMLERILPRKPDPNPKGQPATSPAPATVAPRIPVRRTSAQAPAEPAPPSSTPTPQPSTTTTPRPTAPAAPGAGGAAIMAVDRFEQAMQLAKLAAGHGLPELSLLAVRESLRGGPPVPVANAQNRTVVRRPGGVVEEIDQVTPRVIVQFVELEGLWLRHRAPADDVYRALRDAALPAGRPSEIFLYAQPLSAATLRHPRSLGAMLAQWADRAGEADDLRAAIEARRGQPMSELPAAVLTAQLAATGRDADATNRALRALADRLRRNTLRSASELACHAALPALARDDTGAAALAVVEVALKGFEGNNTATEPLLSLMTLAASRQLKQGDAAGARKRFDDYLNAVEHGTIRYGGDYPNYQRKEALLRVAAEYARASATPDALEALGRFVDTPSYSGGDPPLDDVLRILLDRLSLRPARERYETLRAWTMPAANRRVVRLLATVGSGDVPPEPFTRSIKERDRPVAVPGAGDHPGRDEVLSTATSLIEAAREAGSLDPLAVEARAAAGERIENAEVFSALIDLALGRGEAVGPLIEGRIATLSKEAEGRPDPGDTPQPRPTIVDSKPLASPWADFLLARTAMAGDDRGLVDLGLRLAEALVDRGAMLNRVAMLPRLQVDIARARALREGSKAVAGQVDGGLALWHPAHADGRSGFTQRSSGTVPSWWISHGGVISHLARSEDDLLLFDYPLSGSYEFSVDAFMGTPRGQQSMTAVSHGGLICAPSLISPLGRSESIFQTWRLTHMEEFNRLTIRAEPGKVRYFLNDHLFHEDDDPSPTSPWLGLFALGLRPTAWRAPTLRGDVRIPREVRLSHADRLEGWVSGFYNETQPTHRMPNGANLDGSAIRRSAITARRKAAAAVPVDPDEFDWSAREGEIRGRRLVSSVPSSTNRVIGIGNGATDASAANQSRLYYHRPLRDGDMLTYEFFYEPEQVMVHPALDRLAFLLEPDGVRLHWMTAPVGDTSGLPADNAADEPEDRPEPGPLPLKPGEWNKLSIALKGDTATIELNGRPIYRRALEPSNGRQFGLYHDKDRTSARVRDVVLRGDWPESLTPEQLAGLSAARSSSPDGEADRRARHALIGEPMLGRDAGEVLRNAGGKKPEERYALLADWVLPTPDHPVFRLRGEFTPTDPVAMPGAPAAAPDGAPRAMRVSTGGEVRAPAIELVDAAAATGRLDELARRVEEARAEGEINRRGRLAMMALIQIARGDDAAAGSSLTQLKPLLDKLGPDTPGWARWAELAASARAIARPATREPALTLLETMADQSQKKKAPQGLWEHQVKNLRARGRLLAEHDGADRPFGADPEVEGWARVTHARAVTRGRGEPTPIWTYRDGLFTHHPGHANDYMYLGVPLRGEFQLDCELTSFNWREIRVSYGGLAVGPRSDRKHVARSQYGHNLPDVAVNPPLEKIGDWYRYRLVVRPGSMTAFVDGRQVYRAPLPVESDPWLALHCQAQLTGGARNMRISGRPTVPEQLNLSAMPDLTGWLADYYGDSAVGEALPGPRASRDDRDWDKRGEEIVGQLRGEVPGSKQESVLRYHRPMLEDGEIAYEFYHEPGAAMVHPALDRLAFLLEPGGVRVHRLTDAQYERNGLAPDNADDEPGNRRGPRPLPLKPKSWNRLVLALEGDRLTLRLNDEPVYERAIEPTNQRIFGLFHYADETEARVRNVTYRGRWPRTLPAGLAAPDVAAGEPAR